MQANANHVFLQCVQLSLMSPPPQSNAHAHLFLHAVKRVDSMQNNMQALILTHELTPETEFDTYLTRTLKPVRPLISFGRSAKAWPPCEPSVAVFCWWRDRLSCVSVKG